ncbi:Uncharacterised protein [Mycobacteroides abscessus]|nr:Uncharacterised protein [Mycobacteroides abscessus]
MKTGLAQGIHIQAHPSAPPGGVTGPQRLRHPLPLVLTESCQLLTHHIALELAQVHRISERQVAAARSHGAVSDRTQWFDAVRRRVQDLDGGAMPETGLTIVGDLYAHPLAGERVPDEDDAPVMPGHHAAPVGGAAGPHLQNVADGHLRVETAP